MLVTRGNFPYSFHTRRLNRDRRRYGKPETRRNIPSAFFGLIVTGLFAVSIAEPNWFHLNGGQCYGRHFGLYSIFGEKLDNLEGTCINLDIIKKLRACAVLTLVGIICSMSQFAIDVCGPQRSCFKWIRKNAVGHILSVLLTVTLMGLCYWITLDVHKLKQYGTIHIDASFDVAFYLILGAGFAAFIATTLSLLQVTCERRNNSTTSSVHGSNMQLQLLCANNDSYSIMDSMPPAAPPAYDE